MDEGETGHWTALCQPVTQCVTRYVPYLDRRTGMPSCVGAPAAGRDGAYVSELTGDLAGAREPRAPVSGPLNAGILRVRLWRRQGRMWCTECLRAVNLAYLPCVIIQEYYAMSCFAFN